MTKINGKTVLATLGGLVGFAGIVFGVNTLFDTCSPYDADGFDENGYDREDFNRNGYDRTGFNRNGFNSSGYNREGFNALGYNSDGYDRQDFDSNGYNRSGRDKCGFDRNGYDIDGYDRFGRDSEGYCRNGIGLDGYNRDGYDWQGFGRDKYNINGIDRAGHGRQYYAEHIAQLRERLDEAYKQLQSGEFRYAIYDARIVMEQALRMIVQHTEGTDDTDDRMLVNLKICERKHLVSDNEFLDRLHGVRRICNANGHELDAEDTMTHNKVHFVVMQIRDLLDSAENTLVTE